MARETGKQRSQRIQIDYYRRGGGLQRLRLVCVGIGLLAAGAYVAFVLTYGGSSQLSTGPLSIVHASFENDCNACHSDFTPINKQASMLDLPVLGVRRQASIEHLENACQACHAVGDHYRSSMKPEWALHDQNCGTCHVDHQGRTHDLAMVNDQTCATCHADLADTCQSMPTVKANIESFTLASHGDFASLSKPDPGIIKFDHHQHMLPGQVDTDQKGAFTIEMLEASLRPQYRRAGQSPSEAVQLRCANCHEYAGNPETQSNLISDAELGRYMAPVSFEKHCAACHAIHPGIATEATTPLPHAVPWSRVELLLAATANGFANIDRAGRTATDRNRQPRPGDGIRDPSADRAAVVVPSETREQIETQCLKCHDEASIKDESIDAARADVSPSMIPGRWFRRGLYDHAAHRDIDCRYCHAAAYPIDGDSAKPPRDHETVMIAGIDRCTGCHREATTPTPEGLRDAETVAMLGGQPNWASNNCTTCHRYHTLATPPTTEIIEVEL